MKHIEIVEGVIDATSIFQHRKDQHNLASQNIIKPEDLINDQIQDVIDKNIRQAKNWFTNEMKKFRFIVASFSDNKIDDTVITSLFIPLFDVTDPNHIRAVEMVTKHKKELLHILYEYTAKLKEVMLIARNSAEELTGDWRDANELLIDSGINGLFTSVEQLSKKIYYL